MANEPPKWKPRRWGDPSTLAAFVLLVVGIGAELVDGLDAVLFGQSVSFGYWPYGAMVSGSIYFLGNWWSRAVMPGTAHDDSEEEG